MTGKKNGYRVGNVYVTETELMVLMCFDTAVWEERIQKKDIENTGFAKTSSIIRLICFFYGVSSQKDAEIIIKSVGNKLFKTCEGDNPNRIYPGHCLCLKDEFVSEFGHGKGVFKLGDNHFNNDCEKYIVKEKEIKNSIFDKKEKSQAPTPEPPPQDIQADIHLMAMTILEKLQPVLLNAIYTELMEHKK